MPFLNVEIKAKCNQPEAIRSYLLSNNARFVGTDHQTDTYFQCNNGRLKLREGNIENNLIFYQRSDMAGPKQSHFQLVKIPDSKSLKETLQAAYGIKIIVEKKREIYFIANVKFHIDEVPGLGHFVEIEASNLNHDITEQELQTQCNKYVSDFNLTEDDMIAVSYSDLLLAKEEIISK